MSEEAPVAGIESHWISRQALVDRMDAMPAGPSLPELMHPTAERLRSNALALLLIVVLLHFRSGASQMDRVCASKVRSRDLRARQRAGECDW